MLEKLKQACRDLKEIGTLPRLEICLHREQTAGNDPFYARLVDEFLANSQRRHPKLLLVRAFEYGVAVCRLPATHDEYFMRIEAAGRRNVKKASRLGYEFRRIDYNRSLDDIRDIRQSTDVRQGKVPDEILRGEVKPCENPPSLSPSHDYPYYGVVQEGRVWAFAGCFIAGEYAQIESIFGHADRHADGIVPMLIVGIARDLLDHHPQVKYFAYGTYYGAGTTMRRFKRKFGFEPHRVTWKP